MLSHNLQQHILQSTRSSQISDVEVLQSLWSGYGEIVRVKLRGGDVESVIVKYVTPPEGAQHPRGWNTDRSHQRKIRSYEIEKQWYQHWSQQCDRSCRVARCFEAYSDEDSFVLVLEDLDAAGFSVRHSVLDKSAIKICLAWLASFHAKFLQQRPSGLWPIGTYWHLATRPDELEAMKDKRMKQAANEVNHLLNTCQFQTIVHGDAKVANFCFSLDKEQVAVVDFQYVGGGCGMKDVAYLMGSCLDSTQCERWQDELLDFYFEKLQRRIENQHRGIDFDNMEKEWRRMFPIAWTDFYRFVVGWSPGHPKINAYTLKLVDRTLNELTS